MKYLQNKKKSDLLSPDIIQYTMHNKIYECLQDSVAIHLLIATDTKLRLIIYQQIYWNLRNL